MKRNRIFLSLGMVLLISVFILFTNIGKNRAFSYTEETLGFLKEKCRGFDAQIRRDFLCCQAEMKMGSIIIQPES